MFDRCCFVMSSLWLLLFSLFRMCVVGGGSCYLVSFVVCGGCVVCVLLFVVSLSWTCCGCVGFVCGVVARVVAS